MDETARKHLLKEIISSMRDETLAGALAELIEENRGGLGFLLGVLKERPSIFNPYVLKGLSIYREPASLDRRTAELIAIGAATALRCDHCIGAHMDVALREGATTDEIMDAILIAGAISESSTLSVAFRKLKQRKMKGRDKAGKTDLVDES